MANWYIQEENEQGEIGPLRPSELLDRVRKGIVTKDTKLRKDDSAWFAAEDVGGLFEAATKPSVKYLCPQCEQEICKPPTVCGNCLSDVSHALQRQVEANQIDNQDRLAAGRKKIKNWLLRKKSGDK
jgi:hypothetical protein